MKIIDLLNKIANGEQPKRIAYKDRAYEWGYDTYTSLPEMSPEVQMSASLFSHYRIEYCLNDEVEIIEEEKKIPEKICTNRIINTKDILEFEMIQNKINAEYTHAINSIIDYLKSKGE